ELADRTGERFLGLRGQVESRKLHLEGAEQAPPLPQDPLLTWGEHGGGLGAVVVFFRTVRVSPPSKAVVRSRMIDFPEEASLAGQDEVVSTAEPALVEGCRRGDLSAFEDLYRSHGARMKSVAFNILGNPSDAEDAVQEAFLRVYRGMGAFKGTAKLSTWMFRILVNACHD